MKEEMKEDNSTEETLNDLYLDRFSSLLRHIKNVQSNAILLAERLIEKENKRELARQLIINSLQHDISKFQGIEWDYLLSDNIENLKLAIDQHNRTNFHHPEHWDGVENMPDVFLAEMVVDWKSRSSELGTDFMKWVKEDAPKKFNYSTSGKVYKKIKYFAELLLDEFKKL